MGASLGSELYWLRDDRAGVPTGVEAPTETPERCSAGRRLNQPHALSTKADVAAVFVLDVLHYKRLMYSSLTDPEGLLAKLAEGLVGLLLILGRRMSSSPD